MKRCAAVLLLVLAGAPCVAQQSLSNLYTFQKFEYPNSVMSYPLGINNLRTVVGTWFDAHYIPHGYVWEAGKFTSIDFPNALGTTAGGINDQGDISGTFADWEGFQHGYTLTRPVGCSMSDTTPRCKPTFKQFDIPGAAQTVGIPFEFGPGLGTAGIGINDFGERSGMFATDGEYSDGFLQLGNYVEAIDNPAAAHLPGGGSKCFDISNLSVLACDYLTLPTPYSYPYPITHAFLRVGTKNVAIDYPGGPTQVFGTQVSGINIFGAAVGLFDIQGSFNAMLWNDGRFYTVNFPGMPYNELHSINDRGDMTGAFCTTPDGQLLRGYLAFLK